MPRLTGQIISKSKLTWGRVGEVYLLLVQLTDAKSARDISGWALLRHPQKHNIINFFYSVASHFLQ